MARALTAGELASIGGEVIAEAAARAPAKVLARRTGLTERHIRSLRQREHQPGWSACLALALQSPELRGWLLRVLGAAPGPEVAALHRDVEAVMRRVERIAGALPEEGDRQGG